MTKLFTKLIFTSITSFLLFGCKNDAIIENDKIELIPYQDYDFNNLTNYPHYEYEDENYTSMFGIDVAAHQDIIDWEKVKNSGVEFAFIRLGYRGATEGLLNIDQQFERNYEEAIKNDIKVGIYWYSQPINTKEAKEEAQFVLNVLDNRHLDFPIAYDFEETILQDEISRMHDLSKKERTKMAITFCKEIEKSNYDVMLYTYPYWANTYYDWQELDKYPIWLASYSEYPDIGKPIVMWQYSDEGSIDGIDKLVDLDIMFILKEK